MTKPLPLGCFFLKKTYPNLRKFNLIIENILPKDTIGHLFIVDIQFDVKLSNKLCTPIFEKQMS